MYRVRLSKRALKDADRLPEALWQRILEALRALGETPRPHASVKIKGEDHLYRLRVGDYRVLYDVDDAEKLVLILRIQNRKEVYRDL